MTKNSSPSSGLLSRSSTLAVPRDVHSLRSLPPGPHRNLHRHHRHARCITTLVVVALLPLPVVHLVAAATAPAVAFNFNLNPNVASPCGGCRRRDCLGGFGFGDGITTIDRRSCQHSTGPRPPPALPPRLFSASASATSALHLFVGERARESSSQFPQPADLEESSDEVGDEPASKTATAEVEERDDDDDDGLRRRRRRSDALEMLSRSTLTSLPVELDWTDGEGDKVQRRRRLVIRHLEERDVDDVVDMCVDEWGSYSVPSPPRPPVSRAPQEEKDSFFPWGADEGGAVGGGETDAVGNVERRRRLLDTNDALGAISGVLSDLAEAVSHRIENLIFAWVVRVGMEMRIRRRREGEAEASEKEPPPPSSEIDGVGDEDEDDAAKARSSSPPRIQHDHNVLCAELIVEDDDGEDVGIVGRRRRRRSPKRELVGMAEISVQPPYSTAPPFVLPMSVKRQIARIGSLTRPRTGVVASVMAFVEASSSSSTGDESLEAYVSNVLVRESFRSQGIGRALMAACEGRARAMGGSGGDGVDGEESGGCEDGGGFRRLTLHVDAHETTGKAAQALYLGLGYEPITTATIDGAGDGANGAATNGVGVAVEDDDDAADPSAAAGWCGIYVLDGVPLLYLKKDLKT